MVGAFTPEQEKGDKEEMIRLLMKFVRVRWNGHLTKNWQD